MKIFNFKNTSSLINNKIKFYIELMNAYYHNEEYYKSYKIYNKIRKYYPDIKKHTQIDKQDVL
ncbi:MAG: hypothetical protein L6V95_09535 [Candidatus Melainabacteria bacterium]|nr:MAG: hypothetical protein L6V95_09535 [Candidatus Melainabacteria bacterium]